MGNLPRTLSMNLRVAHVGSFEADLADGVTKTIRGLAKHLPYHGVETEVWDFVTGIDMPQHQEIEGVPVWKFPRPRYLRAPSPRGAMFEMFTTHVARIDLLHLHSVFRAENIWAAALGRPYVLTPNGGYAREVLNGRRRWLKHLWIRLWEKRLWSGARFLHAVCEREAFELSALPSVPPIVIIPNGVRSQDVSDDTERPRPARDWLFIGRLSVAQKGLDLLLQGYAIAKQTCAVPPLRIIGPDFRGGHSTLAKLASALGLTGDVTFEGALFGDDKRRILEKAALLVQLSRWEGMPFTVLEALAMGVPVLVTPGTNIADAVARAEAGWTCDPSPASIAVIMGTIARSSAAERARKSANAQRLIREQFLWERLTEKMADAYRTVLARQRGDAL